MNKFFWMILLFGVLGYVFFLTNLHHEFVHQKIYSNLDVNSSIGFDFDRFSVYTQAESYPKKDLTNWQLANIENEIIGYNLTPVLFFIAGMMVLIFLKMKGD